MIAPPMEAGLGIPPDTADKALAAEGTPARRKEGKRRQAGSAASSVAGQSAMPDADTARAAKVTVLSDLDTKKLARLGGGACQDDIVGN
ncbi:hypothetical protein ACVWZ4_000830 [Bradyrhizobium sp. USDA 4472]